MGVLARAILKSPAAASSTLGRLAGGACANGGVSVLAAAPLVERDRSSRRHGSQGRRRDHRFRRRCGRRCFHRRQRLASNRSAPPALLPLPFSVWDPNIPVADQAGKFQVFGIRPPGWAPTMRVSASCLICSMSAAFWRSNRAAGRRQRMPRRENDPARQHADRQQSDQPRRQPPGKFRVVAAILRRYGGCKKGCGTVRRVPQVLHSAGNPAHCPGRTACVRIGAMHTNRHASPHYSELCAPFRQSYLAARLRGATVDGAPTSRPASGAAK